jgi:hypothetical protein
MLFKGTLYIVSLVLLLKYILINYLVNSFIIIIFINKRINY